jgi:hypothetical protein
MLKAWTHRVALQQREVAMRPARVIAAATLAAAAVVTSSYLAVSTARPSAAAPTAPVTAPSLQPTHPVDLPQPPAPTPRVAHDPPPAPKQPTPVPEPPVLVDGRYDAYIRQVNTRGDYLVVDLVQVFDGQAARDAAIADGMARDKAQYLGVYVRNQNPRLRTLPLAGDLRLDLRGGDCEAPVSHQLTKLATDARAMSGPVHTYYFTLTVGAGAVHQVQEFLAINAC